MELFLIGLGLVFVIEGALYALFPGAMKKMAATMLGWPEGELRIGGLVAAVIGAVLIWLVMP